jgi:hypothetical protein
VGRLAAEQPVEHEHDRSEVSPAVAPQVQNHPAGSSQQRERGLQVGRGDVHAVVAVEREHAHAAGSSRDLADRARPQLHLARVLRRPPRRLGVGDERSVGVVLEREVPREVVRGDLDLTAQRVGHRASVIAEALDERSLEPLPAVGVREQPTEPNAELGDQAPGGPGVGRHVVSVARPLTAQHGLDG